MKNLFPNGQHKISIIHDVNFFQLAELDIFIKILKYKN